VRFNQFTPREYAHAVAVDALYYAIKNGDDNIVDAPQAYRDAVRKAMAKLAIRLAEAAKLDMTLPSGTEG